MSLFEYFKPASKVLPSLDEPLSRKISSSYIVAAKNKMVSEVLAAADEPKPRRGGYKKYSPKDEARVANYDGRWQGLVDLRLSETIWCKVVNRVVRLLQDQARNHDEWISRCRHC